MGIIRILLAIAVLLGHCPDGVIPRFASGSLAVHCFYVISGFLIQMVVSTKYQGGAGWHWRFYLSRVFRIFPLYWLFLLLSIVTLGAGDFPILLQRDWCGAAIWIVNNVFIIGQDVLRFVSFDIGSGHFTLLAPGGAERASRGAQTVMTVLPIAQAWTVALELYFYLLAPYLLARRTWVLLIIVLVSFGVRVALGYNGHFQPEWFYGCFPSELATFIAGALACRAYFRMMEPGGLFSWIEQWQETAGERPRVGPSCVITFGMCMMYLFANVNALGGGFGEPPLGLPNGYVLVVVATAIGMPFAFRFSQSWRFDRYVGDLSYPIYISHFFVLDLAEKINPALKSARYTSAFVLLVCAMLAVILVILVEHPLDRFRHRLFYSGRRNIGEGRKCEKQRFSDSA